MKNIQAQGAMQNSTVILKEVRSISKKAKSIKLSDVKYAVL